MSDRRTPFLLTIAAIVPPAMIAGCVLLIAADSARAAHPGTNGRIAYNANSNYDPQAPMLTMVWPDGSGQTAAAFQGFDPAWSPDGSRVAYNQNGYLWVAGTDGSNARQLGRCNDPTWSPDGKTLACHYVPPGGYLDLYTVDVETAVITRLTHDSASSASLWRYSAAPTWSPDAAHPRIAFYRAEYDGVSEHVTRGIYSIQPDGGALAPLVVVAAPQSEIGDGDYEWPDWSPDGTRLVAVHTEEGGAGQPDRYALVSIAADGTDLRDVTALGTDSVAHPSWSPEGTLIAFLRGEDPSALWVVGADGTNAHPVVGAAYQATAWEIVRREFVVNSERVFGDQTKGDGVCSTGETTPDGQPECTLWAAIDEANASPGKDTITFDVPGVAVPSFLLGGPHGVELTDPVVIDGTTQPGSGRVEVHGTGTSGTCYGGPDTSGWTNGLVIRAGQSTIRGLAIGGYCGYAIVLTGGGGNVVEGNFVGVDASGTRALPSGGVTAGVPPESAGGGILIESADNRIGGADHDVTTCDRSCNLIAGNNLDPDPAAREGFAWQAKNLVVSGPAAIGNVIAGNFIGTDLTGRQPPTGTPGPWWGVVVQGGASGNVLRENVISAHHGNQVFLRDAVSGGNTIERNFVGTDARGTSVALGDVQGSGIVITSSGNQVSGNVVAGTTTHAVLVSGEDPTGNTLVENLIGVGADGATALGNGWGIAIERTPPSAPGSSRPATRETSTPNLIAGNVVAFGTEAGVRIVGDVGTTVRENVLHHNAIGVEASDALDGTLAENDIHHNGIGLAVEGAGRVRISANAIHHNASATRSGLGIDLWPEGVTANDFGDVDTGPNGLLNFPVLGFAALTAGGELRVAGSLDTSPGGSTYRIELFASAHDARDASGYGEGERFLGFAEVTTDVAGRALLDTTLAQAGVAQGELVTATATDANGNTSEFSRAVEAQLRTALTERAVGGATALEVASSAGFAFGDLIAVCPGCPSEEANVVAGLGSLRLGAPLQFAHEPGEAVAKVSPTLDPFMAYAVAPTRGAPTLAPLGPVTLADRYGSAGYDVTKPAPLHAPAEVDGVGALDAATHLLAHAVKPAKGASRFQKRRDVRIVNACSDAFVRVKKPVGLLVPTAVSTTAPVVAPDPVAHERDHFLCYTAAAETKLRDGTRLSKLPKGMQVEVADAFQTRRYDLKKITRLCQPAAKSGTPVVLKGANAGAPIVLEPATVRHPFEHFVCYQAKLATKEIAQSACRPATPGDRGTKMVPKQAKHTPERGLHVANQLGALRLDSTKEVELCLPSTSPDPGLASK